MGASCRTISHEVAPAGGCTTKSPIGAPSRCVGGKPLTIGHWEVVTPISESHAKLKFCLCS